MAKEIITCRFCGKEFGAWASEIGRGKKYCSVLCSNRAKIREEVICVECGRLRKHYAFSMCHVCYNRNWSRNNRETICEYARCFRKKNPKKVRGWNLRWERQNRDKMALQHARRRARKENLPDTLSLERADFLLDTFLCFYCGGDGKLVLDHFVPIARGGGTTRANMIVACGECNSWKHVKLPEEILVQLPLW